MDYLYQSKREYPMEWSILEAMNTLAETISLSDMQIQSICSAASLSKPTFYRYFKNKNHAVRWHMKQAGMASTCKIGYRFSWKEGFGIMASCLLELGNLYRSFDAEDPNNPFSGNDFTSNLWVRSLKQTLTERKRILLTDELEFQLLAAADIYQGAVGRWQKSGFDDPATFVSLCDRTVPEPLYGLLNEPSNPATPPVSLC